MSENRMREWLQQRLQAYGLEVIWALAGERIRSGMSEGEVRAELFRIEAPYVEEILSRMTEPNFRVGEDKKASKSVPLDAVGPSLADGRGKVSVR
jgi:hypothetical protein